MADELDKALITKLKEGYVKDLLKPDVDKFERAMIIRSLLNDKNISMRELARQYNIPRSTIEDWLLYERISEAEYDDLIKKGVKPLTIYKGLREAKTEPLSVSHVDMFLVEVKKKLRGLKPDQATERTKVLLDELVDAANSYHSNIILSEKRRR